MPWPRWPAKVFGCTALLLFLVRLIFPPADFAGAIHPHSYIRLFDFRLDLIGYGLFEFAALVFLLSALVYYLMERLARRQPNRILIQVHFWSSLLFAAFSVFLAHWVNHIPSADLIDPAIRSSLSNWLIAFNYALLAFIVVQIMFVIGAVRSFWLTRNAVAKA
jgi:hypothetical protein